MVRLLKKKEKKSLIFLSCLNFLWYLRNLADRIVILYLDNRILRFSSVSQFPETEVFFLFFLFLFGFRKIYCFINGIQNIHYKKFDIFRNKSQKFNSEIQAIPFNVS